MAEVANESKPCCVADPVLRDYTRSDSLNPSDRMTSR